MHHWYVMIVYIVHNGSIYDGVTYPVADLFASQQACERMLVALVLRLRLNGERERWGVGVRGPAGRAAADVKTTKPRHLPRRRLP